MSQTCASDSALFFAVRAGLAPCWKPHFIPRSHYCLRLRCPCSLWFVGNELAPPCPCSIILIEKVIFHSTEQIGEGESMNSNQELTCSRPTEELTTASLPLWSRWGIKSNERTEDRNYDSVRPHLVLNDTWINKIMFIYAAFSSPWDLNRKENKKYLRPLRWMFASKLTRLQNSLQHIIQALIWTVCSLSLTHTQTESDSQLKHSRGVCSGRKVWGNKNISTSLMIKQDLRRPTWKKNLEWQVLLSKELWEKKNVVFSLPRPPVDSLFALCPWELHLSSVLCAWD